MQINYLYKTPEFDNNKKMEKILKLAKEKKNFIILGSLSGLVNGLLGSGGGIIFVAGCTFLIGSEQKNAQASAIPAMLSFSIISAVLYIIKGTPIELNIMIPVVIGSAAGGIAGAILLSKFSNKALRYIFAAMIIFAGIRMLCS